MRKVTHALVLPSPDPEEHPDVVVICDDGSVWRDMVGHWREDAPVPGTQRATEKAKEKLGID